MIDFIRYSRAEGEIVLVGVGASKARVASLAFTIAIGITHSEGRAAAVTGGRHRGSSSSGLLCKRTDFTPVKHADLGYYVSLRRSDSIVGNGGAVG